MLKNPTIIVVCGLPLSGKTEFSERIATCLSVEATDIDRDIRLQLFGPPQGESGDRIDGEQMKASYARIFEKIEAHLATGQSAVFTATFSSKRHGQDILAEIFAKYPKPQKRIIWCVLEEDTPDEVNRRIDARAKSYTGPVRSVERYLELKAKYDPIVLPCLRLDTSPRRAIEECMEEALEYILSIEHGQAAYPPPPI